MSLSFEHQFKDRALYNFDDNLNQPRHRWYPFKEGFSNQLVREAINRQIVSQKQTLRVLDPFSGSGTTLLTSALLGHNVVGVEINPFFTFASHVKCLKGGWNGKKIRARTNYIIAEAQKCNDPSPLENFSTFTERNGNTKWLFNRDVLRACASTMSLINDYAEEYAGAFRLAATRAAMMCCNAKKDGKCLRYYPDWKEIANDHFAFFKCFRGIISVMIEDVGLAPISDEVSIQIVRDDSRNALLKYENASFDLIVTSPPYLNSFDYSDVYRPELFLNGFVGDNDDLRKIRLKTIRSHVQVKWDGETKVDNKQVKSLVAKMTEMRKLWNKRLPQMVEAYFYDMQIILKQSTRLLRHGAHMWIVVSTSAYKGLHIPVDLILAEIGSECGLLLENVYVLRHLRASGQQWARLRSSTPPLRESLVIFRR